MNKNWMESRYTLGAIIARSATMKQLVQHAEIASRGSERLLIQGAAGVGKKMLARAIHYSGTRATRPLVTIACERLTASNIDEILLGDGSDNPGKLAEAQEGTLLLAGIEHLNPVAQERVLELLRSETYLSVTGEIREQSARIVATVDRNELENGIKLGTFSSELFWLLSEMVLTVPSLSSRTEDVPYLVNDVLRDFAARERIESPSVPYHYMELLTRVDWPENVRQLRNHVESVMVLSQGTFDPAILLEHFEEIEGTQTIKGTVQALLHKLQGNTEADLATVSARN